ncbi:tetratricopeptide repeat protein [Streptomyces sp. NBC_00243]|uniref:tetratricopeptide repeat protein n=1 Tax=Streptomyces sp. NBC_00243 TaxID=2975688 RepID=UPI002DD92EDE|nr:tetratricopeptide repeat protein [Streptomyces sp. NBC_00243]WRZ25054.1 tetratricopeptide repeat protein [Streptomyces sp. NBC_00243]
MTTDETAPRLRIDAAGERSIAAQQVRDAYTGDVVLPAEALYAAEKVTAAPGTSNLPPAGLCLGRTEELAWLRRTLTDRREGAITQTGTVCGLGGIGKSTLALQYAHRHRRDYTLVWWVNAASPDEIETSLTALARRLVPNWAATAERGAQVAWAMQWLAWHPDWLLVYDNVDDPDGLIPYTGALDRGHHLATSRRTTGWPDSTPILPLDTLHPDDATSLLCRLAFKDSTPAPRQQADARALTADLGHFPLALRQAGAYLAQNRGITLDAYRRRLETKLDKKAHGNRAERTIARIWDLTLDILQDLNPLAVEVLHTAAWLAPDDIPHTLLTPPGADPDDTAEAIGILAAYSMLTDTGTHIGVHRLVQTVLRTPRTTTDDQSPVCPPGRQRAEQGVLHHLTPPPSQDSTTDTQWDILIPHLVTLAGTRPPEHHNTPLASAYEFAGHRLHQQGHTARAIPLREAILAQHEQALGDTHPDTLQSRNNLANSYCAAGDLRRAIPMLEATLTQYEQILGHTHPDTLTSRNNLASSYYAAGDLRRAIPLMEATLTQYEQVLGHTHPSTLQGRNNLASSYESAGDLGRAIPLYETTLAQREQILGHTHPDTLTSRNNLAHAYEAAGDLGRAIPLYETTLAQREQILGHTHPDTLTSRNNLAHAYKAAGDLGRAIPLYETTLAQREQILGDTHPDTLQSRNNLAVAYEAAEDLGRAIPLLEATLAQREQILGDTHPDTLQSRNNLAYAYKATGDLGRAIPLYKANLLQCEQVLGDTHPDTLQSRNNLARAYEAVGDLGRAIPLYETTLAQREQVLGDTHPDTLQSRNNLACSYCAAGDLRRAIPLLEATLTQREQILGDTHPHTQNSRSNLASARQIAKAVRHGSTATSTTKAVPQEPSTSD